MNKPIPAKKNPLSASELITDFFSIGRFNQAIINPLPPSGQ